MYKFVLAYLCIVNTVFAIVCMVDGRTATFTNPPMMWNLLYGTAFGLYGIVIVILYMMHRMCGVKLHITLRVITCMYMCFLMCWIVFGLYLCATLNYQKYTKASLIIMMVTLGYKAVECTSILVAVIHHRRNRCSIYVERVYNKYEGYEALTNTIQ